MQVGSLVTPKVSRAVLHELVGILSLFKQVCEGPDKMNEAVVFGTEKATKVHSKAAHWVFRKQRIEKSNLARNYKGVGFGSEWDNTKKAWKET